MRSRLAEHIAGILFVTALLCTVLFSLRRAAQREENDSEKVELHELAALEFVDWEDRFHRALFAEVLEVYYPGQHKRNAALLRSVDAYRDRQFARDLQSSQTKQRLSAKTIGWLLVMYAKFILVYALVMGLTYYGVQTLGVWRFIRRRRRAEQGFRPQGVSIGGLLRSAVFAVTRIIAYFILFSPAYVIAYSLRTRINTDTIPFMIVLGVISNGLLVTYAHRFYTFLVAESRKGYVETARVKNLAESYLPGKRGISMKTVLAPVKHFHGHILEHIYANGRFQYFATLKEQASFLITGLIIIEMALNIHGHLSYEMLRQMLYRNWEIVVCIVLGIYLLVKMTEILTDVLVARESRRYENAEGAH